MNEIALHIEFLLHTHDCVIVPNLGGFVVNTSGVERNGIWGLDAPRCELVFNNMLTYNDGLLAESLMKTNDITFESAVDLIDSACRELKAKISKGEQVVWSNLGLFKELNEKNKAVFIPNKDFIRPQFYGLTNARIKPKGLLSSKNKTDDNTIPLKPFIKYISSGIAMSLLFFFIVVSYNNYGTKSQHAEMVSNPLILNKNNSSTTINKASKSIDESRPSAIVEDTHNHSTYPTNSISLTKEDTETSYYIIIGVYEVKEVAEKTLSALINQGFTNASILKRAGRLDVYSDSFNDKSEALKFLKKFRNENPNYYDAWLLKH